MTNYEVYFGTQERALDSLSMLVDYGEDGTRHPRKEIHEFNQEVRKIGASRWIKQECTNYRWYSEQSIKMQDRRERNNARR